MKRILSFFAAALFTAVSVSAQTVTLDEVCTSLTEHKVTTGKFVQERKSQKLKKPVSSSGVYIICTDGAVWKTEKPFPSVSAVTESKIIQTLPSGKKNVIDGSSNEVFKTVSKTLSSLFSGNKKQLEENFILKDFSAENEQWILMLEPKDRTIASVLRSVELKGSLSGKKAELCHMQILQNESDCTSYEFTENRYKEELSDAEKLFFKE